MGLSVSPGGDPDRARPRRAVGVDGNAFRIGVEQTGTTLSLRLSGEFDWACIGSVEAALERVGEARIKRVVFDLRKLEFMDSAGLRTILRANDRARAESFEVVVVRPLGLANRVFTLTRASRQLRLVDQLSPTGEGS